MHHQRELIEKLLLPALGITYPILQTYIDRMMQICHFQRATKYQSIESPGPSDEGRAWFSIDAMVHSYFYHPDQEIKKGTRIWKKRKMIFFSSCLLANNYRSDYIEMLEPGEVISITYENLLKLMADFPEIKQQIHSISVSNEYYYRQHALLLTEPPLPRVEQFLAENASFINCTSQEVQSTHVNLSLKGYINQLNSIQLNKQL